jgi:hypothetical protein
LVEEVALVTLSNYAHEIFYGGQATDYKDSRSACSGTYDWQMVMLGNNIATIQSAMRRFEPIPQ